MIRIINWKRTHRFPKCRSLNPNAFLKEKGASKIAEGTIWSLSGKQSYFLHLLSADETNSEVFDM